ncbi:MAG: hypothetical protein HC897_17760, partial [Thermoanaerobaculia bacterium]|nr:hypothetical protein [Thermoanaerobaculia bacterium]
HRPVAATLRDATPSPRAGSAATRTAPSALDATAQAAELVDYLLEQVAAGFTLLTWNGLGFDLDVLAEESGRLDDCRRLARSHVDMMFDVVCRLGYPLGLDKVAKAMGLAGKTQGMSGELAPKMWAEGRHDEVLAYVAQDVVTTLELAHAAEKTRRRVVDGEKRQGDAIGARQGLEDRRGSRQNPGARHLVDDDAAPAFEVHRVVGSRSGWVSPAR